MITNKQLDRICDLLVDYRKAIVELTTAAPEDRMAAAYEFAAIDQMVHEMLASWVEPTATAANTWLAWPGKSGQLGQSPLFCDTKVEVSTATGIYAGRAGYFYWSDNIIAYRVVN